MMANALGDFLATARLRHPDGTPITWRERVGIDLLDAPTPLPAAWLPADRQEAGRKPSPEIDISAWRLDLITAGEPPPQRFLLAPLIPLGTAGVLFGPGGVGKSLVALDLCLTVARRAIMPAGDLDFAPGPLGGNIPREAGGAAIFITLEDGGAEIHRRTVALDPANTRAGAPVFVIPAVDLPGFDPVLVEERGRTGALTAFANDGLPKLLESVADACAYPPRLLVLDPAGDFLAGEENSAAVVKPLMRRVREIAREYDCTIILIGHTSKGMDPHSATMRGSGAWVANSRFAYSLAPPAPEKGARAASGAGGLVWGELVKANHAGAPIGKRRPFQRDATTGRLVDASAMVSRPEATEGEMLAALVLVCGEAAEAGMPFTSHGKQGLYLRRAELPEGLAALSRARLQSLSDTAVADEWLAKDDDGHLTPPPDPG